ncbi:MAG: type III pantothenate kinase [Betaproteobacteria bacterium]|nr:type III pantothenate kinase [Betaproteobacteria bacterium]
MILAIDCGNTRVKWGLYHGNGFHQVDAAPLHALQRFEDELALIEPPAAIVVSHVANAEARVRIERAIARFPVRPQWITASGRAGGVVNRYDDPTKLGTDRWAALIGAWHRHQGASVVVNCGTATTIDRLNDSGEFVGGLIIPSIGLMKKALNENTAKLPLAEGRYVGDPRRSEDAIETGCAEATVGAIERARARAGATAQLFLTGGAGDSVGGLLTPPVERVEHLTLEGLVRLRA